MASAPRYVFYGDDFTGASDTLATLAGAGMRTLLFLGVPTPERLRAAAPLDALGIAGAARSMEPSAMRDELVPVGRLFATLRAPLLHYKCCSTFDSSPTVGSLGTALQVLKAEARNAFVPVVGGQPSLGRFCAFGNLFATAGTGREVSRIDRHPTMSRHPVTPMHEADLRRHLATQGVADVASIDLRTLSGGDDRALDAAIDTALADHAPAVLFDVIRSEDLARIGRVIWERAQREPLLVIGASSVAQALIAHWRSTGEHSPAATATSIAPAGGPVFVFSGSQSPVTAQQIEVACGSQEGPPASYRRVLLDARSISATTGALEIAAQQCAQLLNSGASVLAHTMAAAVDGPAAAEVARAGGRLLARVLELAPAVTRAGVAGGDSSSLAVQALGAWALGYAGTLSPGVALTTLHADAPRLAGLEMMLKGGQMGPPDVFEQLLRGT